MDRRAVPHAVGCAAARRRARWRAVSACRERAVELLREAGWILQSRSALFLLLILATYDRPTPAGRTRWSRAHDRQRRRAGRRLVRRPAAVPVRRVGLPAGSCSVRGRASSAATGALRPHAASQRREAKPRSSASPGSAGSASALLLLGCAALESARLHSLRLDCPWRRAASSAS